MLIIPAAAKSGISFSLTANAFLSLTSMTAPKTSAEKRVLSRTVCISEMPYFSAVRTNIPAVPHIEAPKKIIKK